MDTEPTEPQEPQGWQITERESLFDGTDFGRMAHVQVTFSDGEKRWAFLQGASSVGIGLLVLDPRGITGLTDEQDENDDEPNENALPSDSDWENADASPMFYPWHKIDSLEYYGR